MHSRRIILLPALYLSVFLFAGADAYAIGTTVRTVWGGSAETVNPLPLESMDTGQGNFGLIETTPSTIFYHVVHEPEPIPKKGCGYPAGRESVNGV